MNVLVLSNEILGTPLPGAYLGGGPCGGGPRGDGPCGRRLCGGPLPHVGVFAMLPSMLGHSEPRTHVTNSWLPACFAPSSPFTHTLPEMDPRP